MELIERVKEAKRVLDAAQSELLEWCRDRTTPVDKRYDIWVSFVTKDSRTYYGCDGSVILDELIEWWVDGAELERHQIIDYAWLIDRLCNKWDKKSVDILEIVNRHKSEMRDRKIDSIISNSEGSDLMITIPQTKEEFKMFLKEEVMIANFGSCEFDW